MAVTLADLKAVPMAALMAEHLVVWTAVHWAVHSADGTVASKADQKAAQ